MRPERMKKNRKNKKKKQAQEAVVGLRSRNALRDPRSPNFEKKLAKGCAVRKHVVECMGDCWT